MEMFTICLNTIPPQTNPMYRYMAYMECLALGMYMNVYTNIDQWKWKTV